MTRYETEFWSRPRDDSVSYWEKRARRYAADGEGLAAVCSYGMPGFYNWAIHLTQFLALRPWLRQTSGKRVLDVGCGVGRWSRRMARGGAWVTGVDISPTMVRQATSRAAAEGVAQRCRFLIQDLAELQTGETYEFIFGVTVLQHILHPGNEKAAVQHLAAHLATNGRMVIVEVAPSKLNSRCDSAVFRARDLESYLQLFSGCGLDVETITGVDPMPLKTLFLPLYAALPKPIRLAGLAAVTALSLPIDTIFGRRWPGSSWHKVFVLKHAQGSKND